MTIKLIAIDLDETLLRTDKTYDRLRFKRVFEQLIAKDVMFCVATGNSYDKIADYFDEEETRSLYLACDNGNYLVRNQEVVHSQAIPQPLMNEIVDFIDEFEGFHVLLSSGQKSYFRETEGAAYDVIQKFNNNMHYIESFQDLPKDVAITKIAILSDNPFDLMKAMVRILTHRFPEIMSVTSGGAWLDVYHKDGGKGSSIEYLQEKYQITPEETMAFGDSMNDESMMKVAGYSIGMQNADPDLLLSTAYQIGTNNEEAVLTVLEELLQADRKPAFMEEYRIHIKNKGLENG